MTLLIASLRVKNDVSCYHIYLGPFQEGWMILEPGVNNGG